MVQPTSSTHNGRRYLRPVRNYSPWVDPASPSASAWVVLEKTGNSNELAQTGWREQPHGRRDTLVEYLNTGNFSDCNPQATGAAPGFTNLLTRNTVPIPPQPGTVHVLTVLYGYEPGKFTFFVNGQKVANAPANFVPNQADVIGETKLVGDQMPGDANDPLVFHVRLSAVVPLSCPVGGAACSGAISLNLSGGGRLARILR